MGAVAAVLCSLACAKAPGMPHGGDRAHGSAETAMRSGSHGGGAHYAAAPVAPVSSHTVMADRNTPLPRGGADFGVSSGADNFGVYNPGMRRTTGLANYAGEGRGGMQYAGALTQVSAESHGVPRPPVNAPVRTGSIRADVARYNEERGPGRGMQRQSDDPRQPEGSPYRN